MLYDPNLSGAPAPADTRPIYFDYNGSAPMPDEVRKAMAGYLSAAQGNPGAGHWAAAPAAKVLAGARADLAALIGAGAEDIVLTSGATEANNHALKGVFEAQDGAGHIISSATEHDSVLVPLKALRRRGAAVTILPVDGHGRVDPEAVRRAIRPDTRLISVMQANNETGTLNPVREIAAIARAHGVTMHSDAAQSVGKVEVDVADLGVDLLSVAGHKFGAPKGIGALYVRADTRIAPLMHGGGQEGGRRSGTESALLAAGLGAAARLAAEHDACRVRALRDYLWNCLQERFGDRVVLQGHPHQRVPNTLNVAFPGHAGAEILAAMPFLAATSGSACHASCVDMSRVLVAMGVPLRQGMGTVRFSLGEGNTIAEIDRVLAELARILG